MATRRRRLGAAWDAAPLLTRIRWVFLVATFNTLIPGTLLRFLPAGLTPARGLTVVAAALLWLTWLLTCRVERVRWWSVAAEAAVGSALVALTDPPDGALGALTTMLLLRSLYGRRWSVLARLAVLLAVYLAISLLRLPAAAGSAAAGPLIGQTFALAVPTLFARLLFATATRSDRAVARERVVGRAATALLAAADPRPPAAAAANDIVRSAQSRGPVEVTVVDEADLPRTHGYSPVRDHLAGGPVQRIDTPISSETLRGLRLPATAQALTLLPLRVDTDLLGVLALAGQEPVPAECDGALTTLAAALALALDRLRLDADLQRSEQRHRSLVQHSSDVVVVVDADGAVRSASSALRQVAGLDPEAVLGAPLADLVHPADGDAVRDLLWRTRERRPTPATASWRLRRGDGTYVDVEASVTNLLDDEAVRGTVLNLRDVGLRKRAEERWKWRALRDPLTGLANRTLFADRLRQALDGATRDGRAVGVLLIDLDDFKHVNDTLGHRAGDELLVAAAQRMLAVLRPGDTAARLGGDEFAVLLERPAGAGETLEVARRIRGALRRSVLLGGRPYRIRASIGATLARRGDDADLLIQQADTAMYAAKHAGKDGVALYSPEIGAILETEIDRAAETAE